MSAIYMKILEYLDVGNPYVVLGLMVAWLFVLLLIFVPTTDTTPRHKTMTKILLYFSLPSAVVLDLLNTKLRGKYASESESKQADDVFNEVMYSAGGYEAKTIDDLYK